MDGRLKKNKLALNAVAGSGKTSYIINKLDIEKKSLILTYTINNQNNLKEKIIKRYGYMPENIYVYGYFQFLLSFIVKPLCPTPISNITYTNPHYSHTSPFTKDQQFIYSNRIAKYILDTLPAFKYRIERYFENIFIDEVQDLASDDFKWTMNLGKLEIPVTIVGDFNQHIYNSSTRGKNLHRVYKDKVLYRKEIEKAGFFFDEDTLIESYRCSENVCKFIKENLEINIESYYKHKSNIELIEDPIEVKKILDDKNTIKLFYAKSYNYKMKSGNWGDSKGIEHPNVCVVLNPTTYKAFLRNELKDLSSVTLSKLYVACTRTKNNLWFIPQKEIPKEYQIY